jgi:hypothetical protein
MRTPQLRGSATNSIIFDMRKRTVSFTSQFGLVLNKNTMIQYICCNKGSETHLNATIILHYHVLTIAFLMLIQNDNAIDALPQHLAFSRRYTD